MSDAVEDTGPAPTVAPETASIHQFFNADQVEQHATTLIELTKISSFRHDIDQQVAAFERMQTIWRQLSNPHKLNIRARVCEALEIPPGRFDYMIDMDSASDLRLSLEWRRAPLVRQADEQIYPAHGDGWLGRYLAYAEAGEAHLGWHFWAGLVTLAAACRRNFSISAGHKPIYPNLYVLLEGPSGSGKNTAIERSRQLLAQMNEYITLHSGTTDISRRANVAMLPARLTVRSFFDCLQVEGQGKRLVGPMRYMDVPGDWEIAACLVSPEAAVLLGKENFDSGPLIVNLTQAYDGWTEDGTGKLGVIRITNLTLSILLGSTMSWLRSNMTPEVFQGGFMGARCLVIPKDRTTRRFPWEPIVDPIQRAALVRHLVHYAQHDPVRMVFSEAATNLYTNWYNDHSSHSEDDRIDGYFQRKKVYLLKLAMLIAISREHIPTIGAVDMQDAIALLRHEETGMLGCFRQMVAPVEATHGEWVLSLVEREGGKLSQARLAQKASSRMTGFGLREVLDVLQGQGVLAWRMMKQPGTKDVKLWYMPNVWNELGEKL